MAIKQKCREQKQNRPPKGYGLHHASRPVNFQETAPMSVPREPSEDHALKRSAGDVRNKVGKKTLPFRTRRGTCSKLQLFALSFMFGHTRWFPGSGAFLCGAVLCCRARSGAVLWFRARGAEKQFREHPWADLLMRAESMRMTKSLILRRSLSDAPLHAHFRCPAAVAAATAQSAAAAAAAS